MASDAVMEGRWTIEKLPSSLPVGTIWGPATGARGEPVPVVPCDDAAVERACKAMREGDGRHKTDRQIVHLVLRAAGETP